MIDFTRQFKVLKEKVVNERLKIIESASFDNTTLYLDIKYMDEKFTIQKLFPNNYDGREALKQTKAQFDTENKVKKHFNLG